MGHGADAVPQSTCGVLSGRGNVSYLPLSQQHAKVRAMSRLPREFRKICAPPSLNLPTRQAARQRCGTQSSSQSVVRLDRNTEVDEELWSVLDICTDEELEHVHKILFGELDGFLCCVQCCRCCTSGGRSLQVAHYGEHERARSLLKAATLD